MDQARETIAERGDQLLERNKEISGLKQDLGKQSRKSQEAKDRLARQNEAIQKQTAQLEEANKREHELSLELEKAQKLLSEDNSAHKALLKEFEERGEWALGLSRELEQTRSNLNGLLESNSMRVTAPFRYFRRLAREFLKYNKNLIIAFLRAIYTRLPLPRNTKSELKSFAFQRFEFLFEDTQAYQNWCKMKQVQTSVDSMNDQETPAFDKDFNGNSTFQEVNRHKFAKKGEKVLLGHGMPEGNEICIPEREVQKRILIINATTPTPDRDAGSVTAWFFLKAFIELKYDTTFIPDDLQPLGSYTDNLRTLGVRCLTNKEIGSVEEFLIVEGGQFDVIMLYRVHTAGLHLPLVKKYAPQAKIIFNTVDLHYLREERQAGLSKKNEDIQNAQYTKHYEIEIMRAADATIVLSHLEQDLIMKEDSSINVIRIPLLLDIPGCRVPYSDRRDIIFIGGFLHQPNIDAIKYFLNEIWPSVSKQLPNANLLVIGANPSQDVCALENTNKRINIIGYVENLDMYFDRCRVSIAPLRYGAGIKGKIGTSASYGVPCVVSTVAAEGMGMKDGVEVLIADSAESFAEKLVGLYSNEAWWCNLSKASLNFVHRNYSYDIGKERIRTLLNSFK